MNITPPTLSLHPGKKSPTSSGGLSPFSYIARKQSGCKYKHAFKSQPNEKPIFLTLFHTFRRCPTLTLCLSVDYTKMNGKVFLIFPEFGQKENGKKCISSAKTCRLSSCKDCSIHPSTDEYETAVLHFGRFRKRSSRQPQNE